MRARGTSAGCAGSSSSCCAIAWIITSAVALLACGPAKPPPPAHLDPDYADAGPPVVLDQPWPQTGPFYCHDVAREGQSATMCARSREACDTWRGSSQQAGYTVAQCNETLQATCFSVGMNEFCFGTLEKCEEIREAMAAPGLCRTIKAVWTPE
jgi:hypothetical protein